MAKARQEYNEEPTRSPLGAKLDAMALEVVWHGGAGVEFSEEETEALLREGIEGTPGEYFGQFRLSIREGSGHVEGKVMRKFGEGSIPFEAVLKNSRMYNGADAIHYAGGSADSGSRIVDENVNSLFHLPYGTVSRYLGAELEKRGAEVDGLGVNMMFTENGTLAVELVS